MSKQAISNNTHTDDVATCAKAFGRYHTSGANAQTARGLELLSMPTVQARRLGIERLKEARMAGDRLATCVLGMCAMEGVGAEANQEAGLALLMEAADAGSHRAEDYLARHLLTTWQAPSLVDESGLSGKAARKARQENERRVLAHREGARRAWRYMRGPILRGTVSRNSHPTMRDAFRDIMWRGEVTDAVELDCCMVFGARGDAHATYLAALAYEQGRGGVMSHDVACRLMARAMRSGYHDAIVWVRFARRSGRMR